MQIVLVIGLILSFISGFLAGVKDTCLQYTQCYCNSGLEMPLEKASLCDKQVKKEPD